MRQIAFLRDFHYHVPKDTVDCPRLGVCSWLEVFTQKLSSFGGELAKYYDFSRIA